jgi:gamma-glutamyltranspeptidase
MLNILNHVDFKKLGSNSLRWTADDVHYLVEAMKYAFAQRYSLGDPAFIPGLNDVVANLISKQTGRTMYLGIDPTRTFQPSYYGTMYSNVTDKGTSHISVMTRTLAVSLTTTVNTLFGSKLASNTSGLIFNNQMNDFSTSDQPNAFGLAPSAANVVRAGKRPLSSISASILLSKSDDPIMAIGASGGPTIISSVMQVLLQLLEKNIRIGSVLSLPRMHHQHIPNVVKVEPNYPKSLVKALQDRGHMVQQINGTLLDGSGLGNVQVVHFDGDQFWAASDIRKQGRPAGF